MTNHPTHQDTTEYQKTIALRAEAEYKEDES